MQSKVGELPQRLSHNDCWITSSALRIAEKEVAACLMWDRRALRSALVRAKSLEIWPFSK